MRGCEDCGTDLTGRHHNVRFCHKCRKKRQADADRRYQNKQNNRIYACEDCGGSLADRPPNARLCVPCGIERQRAAYRAYDATHKETRRLAARANRANNRKAVRKYRKTDKGRLAAERAEAKPKRKAYLKAYYADPDNKARAKRRRQRFGNRINLPRVDTWHPFNVPDYLKSS